MKYISIDLETTGLNAEKHQILTFSGILEDTSKVLPFEEIPKFNIYILRDDITGSPFAINMNSEIIERIATYLNTRDKDARMIQRQIVDGVFLLAPAKPGPPCLLVLSTISAGNTLLKLIFHVSTSPLAK